MFKLDVEKAEESEILNCQHPLDHQKNKRVPEKHLFLLYYYAKAFDCVDHNKLWKILQEMGIPERNLYAGQQATVRTGHGTTDWFQIGKAVCQGYFVTLLFLLLCRVHHEKRWVEEAQAGSRLLGEISVTTDMQMIPPLCQKAKGLLKKWKRRVKKLA